jgi:quercetin dioxygenase-like cupin family protein
MLLDGGSSKVRIIRLAPGEALPPHRHGEFELMLYVESGEAELETSTGTMPFSAGGLAFCPGQEELRVRNVGSGEATLLAFLAPGSPTAADPGEQVPEDDVIARARIGGSYVVGVWQEWPAHGLHPRRPP